MGPRRTAKSLDSWYWWGNHWSWGTPSSGNTHHEEKNTGAKYESTRCCIVEPKRALPETLVILFRWKRQGSLTPRDSPPLDSMKILKIGPICVSWNLGFCGFHSIHWSHWSLYFWENKVRKGPGPGQIHGFWPNPGQFFPDSPGASTCGTLRGNANIFAKNESLSLASVSAPMDKSSFTWQVVDACRWL